VLRSDKGLDVLSSTPARFVSRAPCISGQLHVLVSRSSEKSGLVFTTSLQPAENRLGLVLFVYLVSRGDFGYFLFGWSEKGYSAPLKMPTYRSIEPFLVKYDLILTIFSSH